MHRFPTVCVVRLPLLVAAIVALAPSVVGAQASEGIAPVTDAMLRDPAPEDWPMWRRTHDGWGYSPLDQIDRGNVANLRMVWSRAMTEGSNQATPLAYGGLLYVPNPGDVIQAIDAATGDLRWEYRRDHPDDLDEHVVSVLSQINRNIAIHDRFIIDTSADDFVFALDAATGRLAWETEILDFRTLAAHQSSGPIVGDGKIFSGRGCMPDSGPNACVRHGPTTPRRGRSGGGAGSFRRRASRGTRPGAACRSRSGATSARGWCRATTPS